jgi:hypothetical protein
VPRVGEMLMKHLWLVVSASPIARGAFAGLVSAAGVDFHAFRSWKSWNDAWSYDYRVASWRWLQGVVYGAAAGAGLGMFM